MTHVFDSLAKTCAMPVLGKCAFTINCENNGTKYRKPKIKNFETTFEELKKVPAKLYKQKAKKLQPLLRKMEMEKIDF